MMVANCWLQSIQRKRILFHRAFMVLKMQVAHKASSYWDTLPEEIKDYIFLFTDLDTILVNNRT